MNEGDMVPDMTLPDSHGEAVALRSQVGAPFIVYFYPKDDTPGCTTEAKDFTALGPEFAAAGVTVFGVSKDSVAKHAKFSAKHDLDVRLLSDEAGAACEAFGTWVEKSMYGRKYMGDERATFLFGQDGKLAQAWRKVRVKGHAAAVLEVAKAL